MSRNAFIIFVLIAYGAYTAYVGREIHRAYGVVVPETPHQETYDPPPAPRSIVLNGAALDFLASYDIRARVLMTRHYWFDQMAKLAPYDFALGWGIMSDTKIIEKLDISQAQRFYFYEWSGAPPAEVRLMAESSANVHLLPANSRIKNILSQVRVGQIVHLKGQLVRINFPNGTQVVSSLVRTDTGPGSCEVIWVTEAE
jgi:hypothetical protein